jgi:hypothetical protein
MKKYWIGEFLVTAARGLRRLIPGQAQKSRMRQELQALRAKRREETLAFARTMMAGLEANQLEPGAIDLLAEILSRRGRRVSGKEEVIGALRRLLADPDYLQPHFDSLESEWSYEKLGAEIVRGPAQVPTRV